MKKLAVAMALASTALASPALARDNAWYVGVEGGVMIVEDHSLNIGTARDAASVDHDYGYDAGGVVGYDFGPFRLETEASYRQANIERTTVSAAGIPASASSTGALVNGTFRTNGYSSALSFMVNGLLDFGPDDGLQGYVGGGAGVARIKIQDIFAAPAWLNDSDTGFAWQALAGVRTPLSRNVDVGLQYRFFNADNVDLVDIRGRNVSTRFRSHSLLGTLTFNFGEPPAPPPVVPPAPEPAPLPPPPPPPVVAPPPPPVCNSGPYIVFFDWDKDAITADAAQTLDNAVSAYANCGNASVMIAGNADRSGRPAYNVALSQRRATNVANYLGARGIPAGAMTTRANGENVNRVPTPDGVRNDQNRNVQINYGPGSGM